MFGILKADPYQIKHKNNSGKNPKNECLKSQYRDFEQYLEVFNLAFLGFNTFVGIVCNLLTLIAIPMAAREKR